MSFAENTVSGELATHLCLILEKCRHIEVRISEATGRGKTFDLTRDYILHHLIPCVRQYARELLDVPASSFEPAAAVKPEHLAAFCRSRLEQCRKHLLQAISLFELLQADERSQETDELDAYYAERFIINDEPSYNPREATNNARVALEMTRLLQVAGLGPQACERNLTWSLPGHAGPDLSQLMGQDLTDLATVILAQSKPRYIHKYPEQPPYQWDSQAEPAWGSFGFVRKATSQLTGDVVAVKSMNQCFSSKDHLLIAQEIGAIEACHHSNLIQLIDAYETPNGRIHLVLRPWAPFTLYEFLARSEVALSVSCPWFAPGQRSSMTIILGILHGLADGLHYLHRKLIKHKDIKPENILLHLEASRDVRPIITDFGISKVHRTGRRTLFTEGTYSYLAPEQVNHTGSSLKADVWQLGCCFAKILTRACGGYTASLCLNDSYQKTDDHRSASIAMELDHFLPTLRRLCASMPDVLRLTCGMLEPDPSARWTIAEVREELTRVMK